MAQAGLHARAGDALEFLLAQVNEGDVLAVVGPIVVSIEAEALGAERVVRGSQALGDQRVFHDLADLALHELGCGVVGVLVYQKGW